MHPSEVKHMIETDVNRVSMLTWSDTDEGNFIRVIQKRRHFCPQIAFNRYRWALRYALMQRHRFGPSLHFAQLENELRKGWPIFGGPARLSWQEARDLIRDVWDNLPLPPDDASQDDEPVSHRRGMFDPTSPMGPWNIDIEWPD